jgi:hypothetical protein
MGRQANWALAHLDAVGDPTSVVVTGRRRLSAEQARTLPDASSLAPAALAR